MKMYKVTTTTYIEPKGEKGLSEEKRDQTYAIIRRILLPLYKRMSKKYPGSVDYTEKPLERKIILFELMQEKYTRRALKVYGLNFDKALEKKEAKELDLGKEARNVEKKISRSNNIIITKITNFNAMRKGIATLKYITNWKQVLGASVKIEVEEWHDDHD